MRLERLGVKACIKALKPNARYDELVEREHQDPQNPAEVKVQIKVGFGEEYSINVELLEAFHFSTAQGVNMIREIDHRHRSSNFYLREDVRLKQQLEWRDPRYCSFRESSHGEFVSNQILNCLTKKVIGVLGGPQTNDKFVLSPGQITVTIQLGSQRGLVVLPLTSHPDIRFVFQYTCKGKSGNM